MYIYYTYIYVWEGINTSSWVVSSPETFRGGDLIYFSNLFRERVEVYLLTHHFACQCNEMELFQPGNKHCIFNSGDCMIN